MKYCITGLPRSRTAWFAAYFTALGSFCLHEGMGDCDSIESYFDKMENYEGNSDSGIAMYPHTIPTVIIERPLDEVKESLGFIKDTRIIDVLLDRLNNLEGLRVNYNDINERLQEITQYCGVPYNEEIAKMFKNMTITSRTTSVSDKTIQLMEELLCHHGQ